MNTRSEKPAARKAAATHVVDRGHEARVDELSEERATHLEHPDGPWVRPSSLDAPPPRQGMTQRWIRHTVRGEADPRNWNNAMREGWTPRPADTVPDEFKHSIVAGSDKGIIQVDDLILCEMPTARYNQRKAYYSAQSKKMQQAVDDELERSQVRGHPIVREHKSTVSHPAISVGRKVEAADND